MPLKTNKIQGGRGAISDRSVRQLYSAYKSSAKERRLYFNLTYKHFWDLVIGDCFYCGQPPTRPIRGWNHKTKNVIRDFYSGIDRVDNHIGYDLDNCVSCCLRCNRMKMDMTLEEFFDKIRRIYYLHIRAREEE